MFLTIEHQTLFVDVAIEMNRKLRDAKQRLIETKEAGGKARLCFHHRSARKPEIAIKPGVQESSAVHLNTKLPIAFFDVLCIRFEAKVRTIGVRADDPKASYLFSARHLERDQCAVAIGGKITTWSERVPRINFSKCTKLQFLKSRLNGFYGMKWRRRRP